MFCDFPEVACLMLASKTRKMVNLFSRLAWRPGVTSRERWRDERERGRERKEREERGGRAEQKGRRGQAGERGTKLQQGHYAEG